MTLRYLVGAILVPSALLGCSGASSGGGGSAGSPAGGGGDVCPLPSAVPAAPGPVDPKASPADQAAATQLITLDALIGRFLRGDAIVYRGTVKATATTAVSALSGPDHTTTVLPESPAIAMLAFLPTWTGNWYPIPTKTVLTGQTAVLMIHAPGKKLYTDLAETQADPATLWAGGLAEDDVLHGVSDNFLDTSCTSCGPNLWHRPDAIVLDALKTTAVVTAYEGVATQGGKNVEVPIETVITARLNAAKPCSLTWDELAALNTATAPNDFSLDNGLQDFKAVGGEWVWHAQGSYESAPPKGRCSTFTTYTIDLYVNQSNLADYGSRNYVEGATMTSCGG